MRTNLCFSIPGLDLYAEIDFRATSRGFAGDHIDPPEAPEFAIDDIAVYEDNPKTSDREVALPKWALSALAESDEAATAMHEYYCNHGED